MKKALLLLSLTVFLATSCSDNDDTIIPACGINNPKEDLEWLKTEIGRRNQNPSDDMKYCYIVQAQLNAQDVFIYQDCNPVINKAIFIMNCEGNTVDTEDNPTAFDQLTNKMIIWKRDDFACQVSF